MVDRTRRSALLGAAAALARPAPAFPDRPLRIVSGSNPGGANAIASRALAQPLAAVPGRPLAAGRGACGAVVRALGITLEQG